jgi:uncharacterized protein YdgA (DUF945 family)
MIFALEAVGIAIGLAAVALLAWWLGKKQMQAKIAKEIEIARERMGKVSDFSKSDTTNSLRNGDF